MSVRKRHGKDLLFFQFFFIFDMPRILQNLHEHANGMLNAGTTINALAMKIGYSTCAIQGNVFKQ